jgi:hypothetical protein
MEMMKLIHCSSLARTLVLMLFLGPAFAAQPGSVAANGVSAVNVGKHSSIKPQAPVDVKYQLQSTPEVGQPLLIRLQFTALGNAQLLDASFRGASDLEVRNRGYAETEVSDKGIMLVSQTVSVIPKANGLHHFNVFASAIVAGRQLTRVVAIPVQVGPKTDGQDASKPLESIKDIDGIAIKPMQAKSSIILN